MQELFITIYILMQHLKYQCFFPVAYNNSSNVAEEVRYLKGALEVILPMCVNCVGHNAGMYVCMHVC